MGIDLTTLGYTGPIFDPVNYGSISVTPEPPDLSEAKPEFPPFDILKDTSNRQYVWIASGLVELLKRCPYDNLELRRQLLVDIRETMTGIYGIPTRHYVSKTLGKRPPQTKDEIPLDLSPEQLREMKKLDKRKKPNVKSR